MFKQMIVSGLSLMILAGCDNADKTDVKDSSVVVEVQQAQQAQQENSATAIYLPGGAGIDFGRKPISDEEIVFNDRKLRKVVYEFSEAYEAIDGAMSSILEDEQYSRHVSVSGGDGAVFVASYQKADNKAVVVRYFVLDKNETDKKTTLILTWSI